MEQDFDFYNPDKKNGLLSKWSQFATALLKLAENKTDSYLKELVKEYKEKFLNNNPEDSKFKCCVKNILFYFNCNLYFKGRTKEIFALSILPLFFPCSYLKCKRAGTNRWKN